jgi:hypothetical protein
VRADWAGSWAANGEKRRKRKTGRVDWAAWRERKRGEGRKAVGWAQLENEREKEMHSNIFEFEFEI